MSQVLVNMHLMIGVKLLEVILVLRVFKGVHVVLIDEFVKQPFFEHDPKLLDC